MNEFEVQLMKLSEEADDIQKQELELRQKGQIFNDKLMGFLKEHGLPQNFTLPHLALLSIRKARV